MSTPTTQHMTVPEFLAWAEAQPEGRYELVDGEVVRMAPERLRHVVGKSAVWLVLRDALVAARLENVVFTDGVSLQTKPRNCREPDCIIAAGPLAGRDPDTMTIDDPLVVVEVVSPNSEDTDAGAKLVEYFGMPTVEHDVLVWPKDGRVDHCARNGLAGPVRVTLRAGDRLRLDPPGIEVDVAALLGGAGASA